MGLLIFVLEIFLLTYVVAFMTADQREERVKFILESDVITPLKSFLTAAPQSRQHAVRLIAELVKTGTSSILFCSAIIIRSLTEKLIDTV